MIIFIKIFLYSYTMRKAQFISPILILAIIIITAYLLISKAEIDRSISANINSLINPLDEITNISIQDLNYRNSLTAQILELASTINSSGTLKNTAMNKLGAEIELYDYGIIINYTKTYMSGTISKTISSSIIVPYPYLKFLNIEQNFNYNQFRTCINTNCNIDYCLNSGSDTIRYTGILTCIPAAAELNITDSSYALTLSYPYNMWNNTLRII